MRNASFFWTGVILRVSYELSSQRTGEVLQSLSQEYAESEPKKVNRFLLSHFPIYPHEADQLIPDGFRVFLIKTELDHIKESPNHNQLCAIAISEERRMVAYLFDSW